MSENSSLTRPNVEESEIVKAVDFQFGFDSLIENSLKVGRMIAKASKDFVIGGQVEKNGDTTVKINPVFGYNNTTKKAFGSVNSLPESGALTIPMTGNDATYIIQLKSIEIDYDEQERAFADFDSDTITYVPDHSTKTEFGIDQTNILKSASGSTAPTVDSGYVKIAEIFVPSDATSIDDCTIKNISAYKGTDSNTEWTSDQDSVYRIYSLDEINSAILKKHKTDGSFKNDIIAIEDINKASVTSNSLQLGGSGLTFEGSSYPNTSTIMSLLSAMVTAINNSQPFNYEIPTYDADDPTSDSRKLLAMGTGTTQGTTANVPIVTNGDGAVKEHSSGALGTAAFRNVDTAYNNSSTNLLPNNILYYGLNSYVYAASASSSAINMSINFYPFNNPFQGARVSIIFEGDLKSSASSSIKLNGKSISLWTGLKASGDTYYFFAQSGTVVNLVYKGTSWYVEGNPIVRSYYAPSTDGANTYINYEVYANGSHREWCNYQQLAGSSSTKTVTFKIPFSTGNSVSVTMTLTSKGDFNLYNLSATSFMLSQSFSTNNVYGHWIAIGK